MMQDGLEPPTQSKEENLKTLEFSSSQLSYCTTSDIYIPHSPILAGALSSTPCTIHSRRKVLQILRVENFTLHGLSHNTLPYYQGR